MWDFVCREKRNLEVDSQSDASNCFELLPSQALLTSADLKPSADKLVRQQFRTCPIWARALGPLLMNNFP